MRDLCCVLFSKLNKCESNGWENGKFNLDKHGGQTDRIMQLQFCTFIFLSLCRCCHAGSVVQPFFSPIDDKSTPKKKNTQKNRIGNIHNRQQPLLWVYETMAGEVRVKWMAGRVVEIGNLGYFHSPPQYWPLSLTPPFSLCCAPSFTRQLHNTTVPVLCVALYNRSTPEKQQQQQQQQCATGKRSKTPFIAVRCNRFSLASESDSRLAFNTLSSVFRENNIIEK